MARKAEKPKRRGRDSGVIRYRKARALPFEAEWRHSDGRAEYRGFQSREAAAAWLDSLVAKRKKGHDTAAGGQSFEAFIKKWLGIKKAKKLAPSTMLNYKFYAEVSAGQIGGVRIDSLTLEHMETLSAYLVGAQFQNIHALFSMLGQAFKYARSPSLRWMTDDPLEGLKIPGVDRRVNQVLSEARRTHMLDMAALLDDPLIPLLPLWHLYSRFGLRKGEGIALEWRDVDWDARTLTIDESITNVGPDNLRGKTKTKRTRVVPLPPDMMGLLKEHQTAQRQRGLYPSIFVDRYGETVTPQHIQYRWSLLRKKAGCPKTTIHDLRHTCLTILALSGVPENIRMALAGHSTLDMARLYSDHASLEDVRKHVG